MAEILDIYLERFLENEIQVQIKKDKEDLFLTLVYNNQDYQICFHPTNKVSPVRFNIHDIQLSQMIQTEDLVDKIENIFTYLPVLQSFCASCNKKLDWKSEHFITCGDLECAYKMEEIPIHPKEVVEFVHSNPNAAKILLMQTHASATSERKEKIFEPFPFFLLETPVQSVIKRGDLSALAKKEKQDKVNKIKNFDMVTKILEHYTPFLSKVSKYQNDEQIIKEFGLPFYKFVKFVFQSNKTRMELHHDVHNKYQIYKVTHEMDVEDRMTTKSKLDTVQLSNVLFHGSSIENWYSIIRNGLKITSKTALMTTGSAYGVGLYFSNDVNLSYSYSKVVHHGFLGVYQIYDDLNKYKKTENIFVVNDEQIVLLRYLIYFSKPMDQKTGAEIQKYFQSMVKPSVTKARFDIGSRRQSEALCEDTARLNALSESVVPKKVNTGGITKILKEYKEITQKKLGFNVEIQNENMFAWHVMISEFDEEYPIAIDMKKYKVKEIQLEILFPSNYPFHPPFVRILNPRFKYQTGHITSEGAICMELLTPSGWTPIQSIESLLVQIKALIIEGDGRLDEKRWNQPYSLAEAKKSFERVARGHGWLK